MTYEERLHKVATMFSEERNERKWRESSDPEEFKYESIIAVAMQADAIREALHPVHTSEYIDNLLKYYGYIPEKEE